MNEEFVIRIYGGDDRKARKIIAETEVLATMVKAEYGVYYTLVSDEPLVFKKELTEPLWLTGVEVSTPQRFFEAGLPRWTRMQTPWASYLIEAGDSFTVEIPKCLLKIENVYLCVGRKNAENG